MKPQKSVKLGWDKLQARLVQDTRTADNKVDISLHVFVIAWVMMVMQRRGRGRMTFIEGRIMNMEEKPLDKV